MGASVCLNVMAAVGCGRPINLEMCALITTFETLCFNIFCPVSILVTASEVW